METSGFKKVDERQLQLGQLQIIVVPKGMIGAVLVNGEGHFLLEGRHFISHNRFQLLSLKSLSDEYVNAGTRHRILVPAGKLGLGVEAGEPQLLEPGKVMLRNSALFKYAGSVDITQSIISHGSLSIVTVRDGQFGISYRDGVIELLRPGRHTLASATHVPGGFISAGQQTLRISEVTGMSSDNVELRFDAAICMRVVDPQKAVVMLTQGKRDLMDELQANIQERAKLALSIIIGNNSLNRKHGATMQMQLGSHAEDASDPDAVQEHTVANGKSGDDEDSFRQYIHDVFMHSFSASMRDECGVLVIDMSIEDVVIVNQELATAMASAAVANSNLEKATIEAEIVQVTANADAKVALIAAQGKGKAMAVTAKADAERINILNDALASASPGVQQLEHIRTSAGALSQGGSTVMLAQDSLALTTLLGGAQGSRLAPHVVKQ
jgi:regulator of protease activity HflC (stomatin/prohibitin superfamily)